MTSVTDGDLTWDAITGDYRILQRRRGHRYSLDDLATAAEAAPLIPDARRYVDLGCGIGSVLLMVSWKLRDAAVWGVEALEQSIELARRSVRDNDLEDRVTLLHGDLRDLTRTWTGPRVDLVTGTPPYLPRGTALESPDAQRAAARIELRGGVEDYLAAAARIVAHDGRVVVCADARRPERVLAGAEAASLLPLRRRDIVPREGARPLFAVWTLRPKADSAVETTARLESLRAVMRDADGARTARARAMRAVFGL
ncbi:MAG: methyltransferase domain-containing protein [Polyangiaceae bacterium]